MAQEAVGKGVRRITAVTGPQALKTVESLSSVMDVLTERFNCTQSEVPERVEALQQEIKKLQQQLKKGAAADLQGTADKLFAGAEEVQGAKIIVGEVPPSPLEQVRQQIDRLRQKAGQRRHHSRLERRRQGAVDRRSYGRSGEKGAARR